MLFRKHIVSTRTLFQLTVALIFFVAAVGAAVAAGSGNPPLLVPSVIYTVAGNPEFTSTGSVITGYGGDGALATPSITTPSLTPMPTLSAPLAVTVDSVGNVYLTDAGNDVIREVNYQTGIINIVAGVTPHGCSGVTCTPAGAGCADGVLAYQSKIGGKVTGIAVDGYGNVYFTDNTSSTVSVVYRGGTRVAQFISLVNPAAAPTAASVQVGYVYHIAGEINLSTCSGSTTNSGAIIDNAIAFENTATATVIGATLHGPQNITLDSAGNIYIADIGNATVRVINTQTTLQTFFQYTVQPGYMRSITNCNAALTTTCPGLTTGAVGTGINGPVNAIVFNSQYATAQADAYGNLYQLNGTGQNTGVPYIYAPAAYAGGAPLTNLLTVEAPTLSTVYSPTETAYPVPSGDTATQSELPLTYGNSYISIGNPTLTSSLPNNFTNVLATVNEDFDIRASSLIPDNFGTLWFADNHYPELSRIDQYTSDATGIIGSAKQRGTASVSGLNTVVSSNGVSSNYSMPASFTNPWNCVYGASGYPWINGPQTYDPEGDGCPAILAEITGGRYNTSSDGLGNIYYTDSGNNIIRVLTVGNTFPATAVVPATTAWSATTAYPMGSVVSYTPCTTTTVTCPVGQYYKALVASTGSVPSQNAAKWQLVSVTQPIQVHFDASNIPVTGGVTFAKTAADGSTASLQIPDGPNVGYTTNAFTITGSGDFSIDMADPEFPMGAVYASSANGYSQSTKTGNFAMYPVTGSLGLPTCTQLGLSSPDLSWDCLVYVTFSPTQPGLRQGQLVATTANGSVYNFQLTGIGTGGQLAIDGGQQTTVAATGLGTISSIAVTSTGIGYVADSANNRIVVPAATIPFSGLTTIGSTTVTSVSSTANLAVGDVVTGPLGALATGTTIASIGTGTITLSTAATTTSGTAISLSAIPPPTVTIGPSITVSSTLYGVTTTTASTLSNPMGVAVDAAGNLYISDTGHNRILEYNPNTSIATLLGNYLWVPGATCDGATQASDCPVTSKGTPPTYKLAAEPGASVTPTTAPAQYAFKAPQGLAVDTWGNVYVADTGNAAIVEIPSNSALGGAIPLFQYTGAPTFTTPVAVAVDSKGYIYVADQQNPAGEIVRIPPGGGDLQPAGNAGSALTVQTSLPLFGGSGITTPNGVVVDAAGNVYVSDSTGNAVWVAPSAGAPNGNPYTLSFSGLSSPAGLALDANGNLYVADSGNKQVLQMNRQNPTAQFGLVPEALGSASGVAGTPTGCPVLGGSSPCTGVLTVTNIGNQPVTLTSPFLGSISNTAFSVTTAGHLTTCASPIPVGTSCTISPLFTPLSSGSNTTSVTVNGTQSVSLTANGANPEVKIVLSPSNGTGTSPNYTSTAAAEVITATVSQPHTSTPTPTGTVTFSYVIDQGTANAGLCGASGTSGAVALVGGVATYTMPAALAQGLVYTVSATYTPGSSDTTDSTTNATPIVLTVPGITEAVTATSVSYTYGTAVPAITGTVTPAPATGVTYKFTSGASQYSAIGVYPVQVVFSGTGFCSYGFPVAYVSGTTQATVTEKAAPLTVVIPAYTTVYGAASYNYASGMTITGAVGNDLKALSATFTPANSQILDVNPASPAVNPFPVVPTMTGKPIGNYSLTITNGTDTVTAAPAGIAVTAAKTSVANTTSGLASATYSISVGTLVAAGYGVPTGTVSVTDYFVPITSTGFIPTPTAGVFPTVNGVVAWPSSTYNYQTGVSASTVVIPPCTATVTTNCNAVVTLSAAGAGTFTLPATEATTIGTHYLSFAYSGDAGANGDGKGDFACSVVGQTATASCPTTSAIPFALIVDNPDFTLTSTAGAISVLPGVVPSGNGLPTLPNQNSAATESGVLTINDVLSFAGTINLTCATQHPTWVFCAVQQFVVTNGVVLEVQNATLTSSSTAVPFVLSVWTPTTLPLGFNTSQLRTTATRTVLAFLPFGILAFCVRRRRRLSKALWMLIAIAAVSAGMSGCGGNQVDFYTAVPTGPQTVTVTAAYTYVSTAPTEPAVSRSYVMPININ